MNSRSSVLKAQIKRDKLPEKGKGADTLQKYNNTLSEELIFAFCSPIGSIKKPVIDAVQKRIKEYGYKVEIIKLSSFFKIDFEKLPGEVGRSKGYTELMAKITEGNRLRQTYKLNSILADLAIEHILLNRLEDSADFEKILNGEKIDPTNLKSQKICYIIDSLKNLDELRILQSIYRYNFYLFSVFSPLEERKRNLSEIEKLNPEEIDTIGKNGQIDHPSPV